jgi:hypothetical protein
MEAAVMNYRVTNPATGKVESEFPTATDAEILCTGPRLWPE